MKKILQINGKSKVRKARAVEVKGLKEYGALEVDSRMALIKELIPIGLMHVAEELQRDVEGLAGKRYMRDGIYGYDRWGEQEGSVYILDQKIPIKVPRVRDTINNREVTLSTYKKLQEPTGKAEDKLLKKVLYGLSCRDYRECSEAIPEALSLSPSSVSRRYIKASQKKLKELTDRRLEGYDIIAVVMDGKTFGDDEMIIALGVTVEGRKVFLGIIQSSTENHKVCKDFLLNLIDRGLRYDKGLLCIIDGAKGIRKAINEVFGIQGIVQRCQWHKRENIVAYLPKHLQKAFRKKLQSAYSKEDYKKAKASLQAIKTELRLINESAVNSLEEGFEETLTIQRLGMHRELMRSFKTTNMIESVMSLVGQRTDKVDYWKNSNQKQRWVATSLLSIEQRLSKVNGYRHLIELRNALQREIQNRGRIDERKEAVAA